MSEEEYYNKKWKRFLKENKKRGPYVNEGCGGDVSPDSPMPPMPPSVPIPSDDVDPMALGVELGGLGLDPATAQSVIDLLLVKGYLGPTADPVDPVGPPMMEHAQPPGGTAGIEQVANLIGDVRRIIDGAVNYDYELTTADQMDWEMIVKSLAQAESIIKRDLMSGGGEG